MLCQAQDPDRLPEQTPEHEAAKQTETMQREIKLTPEQAKRIYEINLKYATQRMNSENRRENAMERIKNKNNDYKKVLTPEQFQQLENRRSGIYSNSRSTLNTTYRTLAPSAESTSSAPSTQAPNSTQNDSTEKTTFRIGEVSINKELKPTESTED